MAVKKQVVYILVPEALLPWSKDVELCHKLITEKLRILNLIGSDLVVKKDVKPITYNELTYVAKENKIYFISRINFPTKVEELSIKACDLVYILTKMGNKTKGLNNKNYPDNITIYKEDIPINQFESKSIKQIDYSAIKAWGNILPILETIGLVENINKYTCLKEPSINENMFNYPGNFTSEMVFNSTEVHLNSYINALLETAIAINTHFSNDSNIPYIEFNKIIANIIRYEENGVLYTVKNYIKVVNEQCGVLVDYELLYNSLRKSVMHQIIRDHAGHINPITIISTMYAALIEFKHKKFGVYEAINTRDYNNSMAASVLIFDQMKEKVNCVCVKYGRKGLMVTNANNISLEGLDHVEKLTVYTIK